MNYNQFKNISCYEEFEIRCALTGISKIEVLDHIGFNVKGQYWFFVSNDGIFNWYNLEGNHIEDPEVLKEIKEIYIPKTITKCIIPNSVTRIDKYAFFCCESLKEITIPNNVTSIGKYAFYNCISLTSITISTNSITSISTCEFSYCTSLISINIPDSVTRICNGTFYKCKSLTSITIPDDVTSIGIKAFYDCVSLKEVIFKGKTLDEVKQMKNYPFGIKDENVFKFS
jgi:hypothetical protein